jgi:hypothetical protein
MKCEPEQGGPCRRCRVNKTECVFKPRANARSTYNEVTTIPVMSMPMANMSDETSSAVLARLAAIESVLGIRADPTSPALSTLSSSTNYIAAITEEDEGDSSLSGLWQATANLRRFNDPKNVKMWSRSVVSQLWVS